MSPTGVLAPGERAVLSCAMLCCAAKELVARGPERDILEQVCGPKGQHSEDLQPPGLCRRPAEQMIYHDGWVGAADGCVYCAWMIGQMPRKRTMSGISSRFGVRRASWTVMFRLCASCTDVDKCSHMRPCLAMVPGPR